MHGGIQGHVSLKRKRKQKQIFSSESDNYALGKKRKNAKTSLFLQPKSDPLYGEVRGKVRVIHCYLKGPSQSFYGYM